MGQGFPLLWMLVLILLQLTDSISSLGNNYTQFYIPLLFPGIWDWENLQML